MKAEKKFCLLSINHEPQNISATTAENPVTAQSKKLHKNQAGGVL